MSPTVKAKKLLKMREIHTLKKFHSSTRPQEHPTKIQTFLEQKKPISEPYSQAAYLLKKASKRELKILSQAVFLEMDKLKDLVQELKTLSKAQFSGMQSKIHLPAKSLVVRVVVLQISSVITNPILIAVHRIAWSSKLQKSFSQKLHRKQLQTWKMLSSMARPPKHMEEVQTKEMVLWWRTEQTGKTLRNKPSTGSLQPKKSMESITVARQKNINSFNQVFLEVDTKPGKKLNLTATLTKLGLEAALIGRPKQAWLSLWMSAPQDQIHIYKNKNSLHQTFLSKLTTMSIFQWRKSRLTWTTSVVILKLSLRG